MKKTLIYLSLAILILVAIFFLIRREGTREVNIAKDPKNAEYLVEGQKVKLVNGISEVEAAPGSSTKIVTKYFGNELEKDLDEDGRLDTAFLITQNSGGSGTFFYVVAALNKKEGFVGSDAVLLGDRIAPQTTESGARKIIIVNYADRKQDEPFTTAPSVGKSIWLLLDPETMRFGEVAQNFEGESR